LKPRSLQVVNACTELGKVTNFRLLSNAVVGVFLQRQDKDFVSCNLTLEEEEFLLNSTSIEKRNELLIEKYGVSI
jgi:hypothetical protein